MDGEDGIKTAAKRKLFHELGIEEPGQMNVMGRFIYEARSDPVWVEHELDYVIWWVIPPTIH
jgi:isopentenyldiphosphate isomerase